MMNMRTLILTLLICVTLGAGAQVKSSKPFGFAVCSSMTDATPYRLTGGGKGRSITLRSDGQDMRQRIMDAINNYDVIVFDGKGGDFVVSSTMYFSDIRNKTIRGINNARICTRLAFTKDIHQKLDSIGVKRLSTQAGKEPFVLSNGSRVKEECEAAVRQFLIDYLDDEKESFRRCGLFAIGGAENIIMQNLQLVGPGAMDISGDDLLTLTRGSRHMWIDHVDFLDGVDGNFDINSYSDLITVSWCHFHYSDRTYVHANTNLIGSSDNGERNGEDALNVTFAYCHWGKGCNQRMPMVRFGTIHLLNCFYDCVDNHMAVNPRRHSEVLIEGCYFAPGVKKIFSASDDATSYVFRGNIYSEKFHQPADRGSVNIPYKYKAVDAGRVPGLFGKKK